ncbi:hypothetical protein GTA51_10230 [Desulfovibrio aerotolerans]|uniref:Uncharacterized protein n=1 Tax=Solidesulfovibrio aerotolerans TaxID=295255 RepID=A0A7C9IL25_9BACT|nr:hypothetical protein [Solidesulfovibrio aerotolerans]MYL83501.1 hypothetical protein [Solidesulfovibrio aerotolerans]
MRSVCKMLGLLAASWLAIHCCAVPAQAISLPVTGEVKNSAETFTGTAVVALSGDGSIDLLTSRGVTCQGVFGYVTRKEGRGTVMCQDGRKGYFQFVSAGFSGTGAGKIDDENFEFRIGN